MSDRHRSATRRAVNGTIANGSLNAYPGSDGTTTSKASHA